MYVCMYVCVCKHVHVGSHRVQKRTLLELLELELQVVASCPVWLLGAEL